MVKHHRVSSYHQLRKGEAAQQQDSMESLHLPPLMSNSFSGSRKTKPGVLGLILLFFLLACSIFFAPCLLFCSSSASLPSFYSFGVGEDQEVGSSALAPCSWVPNNSICCDRTAFHTDVCLMRGDVRTHSLSNSVLLHSADDSAANSTATSLEGRIRPYTRKWEANIMANISELRLRVADRSHDPNNSRCDVQHDVPAVVFSTGGYTGNVYHEFNDGIIPLYITSRRFNKRVVFAILDYHNWWVTKYSDVLSRLSDYPPINFSNDSETHCFPEAIVGLRFHGDLAVDAAQMKNGETVRDFRQLLDEAYRPRIRSLEPTKPLDSGDASKPKLVIISRNGSRAIENEGELVGLAEEIGFRVEVLRPERTTELAKIYRALNSSDALVGVHGAAMTHFLFMRPGSAFIQVVPLGTDWAAQTYYGEPAVKMGLWYVGYRILPRESSLYREYGENDQVLRDPSSVSAKGWQATKKVYLDTQNVRLDLARFRRLLVRARHYLKLKRRSGWIQKLEKIWE